MGCSPLFTSVHLCSPLFSSVHLCSPLFSSVLLCSPLFTCVLLCSPLFTSVHLCSPLFTSVHLCSPLFSSALSTHFLTLSLHLDFGLPLLSSSPFCLSTFSLSLSISPHSLYVCVLTLAICSSLSKLLGLFFIPISSHSHSFSLCLFSAVCSFSSFLPQRKCSNPMYTYSFFFCDSG